MREEVRRIFGNLTEDIPKPPGTMNPEQTCHHLYSGICCQLPYKEEAITCTKNLHFLLAKWKIGRGEFPILMQFTTFSGLGSSAWAFITDDIGGGQLQLMLICEA